jgi:hypothetical protein
VSSASLRSPRGGAPSGASVQRFDVAVVSTATSPSSPPRSGSMPLSSPHRRMPARLRVLCRVPRPPFARRPPLARRESPDGRDCCDLCAVIGCCVTVSFFEMSYQVCPRLSMLETHSLTHVHKRVSAELVKHAPSGAPEPLICAVVAPRPCASPPRHDIARRSRVRRARACARRRRQW